MTAMHSITPNIRTGAYSILRDVARAALETARLGIVRGPVGIGKTYALRQIADELTQGKDEVFLFEAPADKSKAIQRFYSKALFDLGFSGHGGADPFEFFKGQMLDSFPFRRGGPWHRNLLIVDEAQRLAPNILETLRQAYDRGQEGRDGRTSAPAFGIILVGNHHFLSRGGHAVAATFDALMSRCPMNVELSRPTQGEIHALARSLFPESVEMGGTIAKHGIRRGNLREMVETHAMARHYAAGGPISSIHLDKAMLLASRGLS